MSTQKCGFVTVIGAPNAGKSTLVNRLVGTKVSIVSRKVQTTRRRILGILLQGLTQVILVDTPGIFTARKTLETQMVNTAWATVQDADILLVLVDAVRSDLQDTFDLLERLPQKAGIVFLVLNKIDRVSPPHLLSLTATLTQKRTFDKVFMISATTGDGVQDLTQAFLEFLPESPWLYPEDQASDLPLRSLAADITREKVFHLLHQELPYEIMVETEKWEEVGRKSIKISQVIHVNRETQRKIVLGHGGQKIKAIGAMARQELSHLLGQKVHLFLHVKVTKDWIHKEGLHKLTLGFS